MNKLVQENWIALLLALLVGILVVFPAFYFRYFDGAYQGIDLFGSGNEDFYLTQIQEIYDGHWSFGSIYLAEGKDNPYVQPPLPAMIVAFLGKLLGLSAQDVNLLTKFLFPAILTVIVYLFFSSLTKRKDIAVLMTAFVMLIQATWIFLNPSAWLPFLLKGEFIGTNLNFISYARSINPQVSSIFFFGYLFCIWKFLFANQENTSNKWGYLSAAIAGLSFYTYFYAYSFLAVFNGILGIWFLYSQDRLNFKRIFWVSLGALIISVPYWINFFGATQSPFYSDLTGRIGIFESHKFVFSRVWWLTVLFFILGYRKFDKLKLFILAFLITAFIVTNQQLITGRITPMVAHYHWYYIAPISGAILIYLFFLYLEKIATLYLSRIIMGLMLLVFLWAGVLYQKVSYAGSREWFLDLQRYAPVISWLDKNVETESTIFANEILSNWIPAYTQHNIYQGGGMQGSLVSKERFKHNFLINSFLDGVDKDSAKKNFYENREAIGGSVFGIYYRDKNGCYGCFPDSVLDELILEYQNFLSSDLKNQFKKYSLDYLIWDKEKNPKWQIDRFLNKKIYDEDNIIVYEAS